MDIADRLQHIMRISRFSEKDVANAVGCTQSTLSSYMLGKTMPNSEMIIRLCEFFHVSADYLLGIKAKHHGKYWENITDIYKGQRNKGMVKYGQGLEDNPADIITRIRYLQEELVDALMYCEWIKDKLEVHDE